MTLQTHARTTLDTDGHLVLPSALMDKIGLKEKTEIAIRYNGKIITISFSGDTRELDTALKSDAKSRLDAALKKIDAKNPIMSDEEIGEEIKAYRKERRESRQIA